MDDYELDAEDLLNEKLRRQMRMECAKTDAEAREILIEEQNELFEKLSLFVPISCVRKINSTIDTRVMKTIITVEDHISLFEEFKRKLNDPKREEYMKRWDEIVELLESDNVLLAKLSRP